MSKPGNAMLLHCESKANAEAAARLPRKTRNAGALRSQGGRPHLLAILPQLFIFLLLPLLALASTQNPDAQTSSSLTLAPRLFSIGYLRRESTGHPSEENLERLRAALGADAPTQAQLKALGYTGIGLFACDGPTEMVRRLNTREFDIAFTPANLYRQQTAGYTPILKARRADDIYDPVGSIVLRRGMVFVSPRGVELFHKRDVPADQVTKVLGRQRIAVVSAQSAAGFTAPLVELHSRYRRESLQGGVIYFDSSEEVVKAVMAGLADIGACEEGALERVLAEGKIKGAVNDFVLLRTNPVVTDPVIVRASLSPRHSALGRVLRLKIRAFSLTGITGDTQYVSATDQDYGKLIELFKEFDELTVGEGR